MVSVIFLLMSFPALALESFDISTCSIENNSNADLGLDLGALKKVTKALEETTLAESVARNSKLVKSASWLHGASQRGFEIYIPLIQATIGTEAEYDTLEFAIALRNWQKKQGYGSPNGALEVSAFMFMKDFWQEERGLDSAIKEKKRVSISQSNRYQGNEAEGKGESLWQAGEKTYSAYEKMIAAARKAGISEAELTIVSPYRDPQRQAMLRKGVSKSKVGYTIAKKSVHSTGRALDLYVGGVPTSTEHANRLEQSKSAGYQWLVKNAGKFGFKNYFYEPWHWEYVGRPSGGTQWPSTSQLPSGGRLPGS